MERSNKLCNAFVLFNNPKSVINAFELVTCREFNDYQGGTIIEQVKTAEDFLDTDEFGIDEPFYRVFAVYKPHYYKARKAIGDFYNISDAIVFLEELTGSSVNVHTY
tara:strand:+ start:349 stop:669 length:321 start_codon:yes stop_codon:yes gene_type:complete